jgi:transcriptional regulator with XRE-family HTH domain
VDNRAEVREFLLSRRAKITPQQAGLADIGARRVPGLRRGEVAALAGVSVEYYSKLERGALAGVSASVLDAVARALQFDDAERATCSTLPARPTALAPVCAPPPPHQTLDPTAETPSPTT